MIIYQVMCLVSGLSHALRLSKAIGKDRHALVLGVSIYTMCIYTSGASSVSANAKGSVGSSVLSAALRNDGRLTAPRPYVLVITL